MFYVGAALAANTIYVLACNSRLKPLLPGVQKRIKSLRSLRLCERKTLTFPAGLFYKLINTMPGQT